jgi:hypothetical protein
LGGADLNECGEVESVGPSPGPRINKMNAQLVSGLEARSPFCYGRGVVLLPRRRPCDQSSRSDRARRAPRCGTRSHGAGRDYAACINIVSPANVRSPPGSACPGISVQY